MANGWGVDVAGFAVLGLLGLLAAVWLVALVDAVARPAPVWSAAGRSKGGWVVGLLVFGAVAELVYLVSVRPQLRAVGRRPVATAP